MSIKSQIQKYWKETPFKGYFYAALIINFILIAMPFALKDFLPPLLPLFYQRPVGESQLISTFGLAIAPGISLVITITNTILSFTTKDIFLKKMLAVVALIVSILTAITIIKIVFLVGFF